VTSFPTFEERPDLFERWMAMPGDTWPEGMEFIYHDPVMNEFWPRLRTEFPEFQFLAVEEDEELLGIGHTIPFRWSGDDASLPDGLPTLLPLAFAERAYASPPTALCALLVAMLPIGLARGLSAQMLSRMKNIAAVHGLDWVVAPVRPTDKHNHLDMRIEEYATWRREDGQLVDPWLRTHERIGGRCAGIAPAGNRFVGTVAQWRQWTGLALAVSGDYVIPFAVSRAHIDIERDIGVLTEPNVWMVHLTGYPQTAAKQNAC